MDRNISQYTVSQKNDTDVACYNFDMDQPYFNNFWQVITVEFELS